MRENTTLRNTNMRNLNMKTNWKLIGALASLFVTAALTAATQGPDGGGYKATDQTAYSFIDISGPGGGSAVLRGVDDGAVALTIPFNFNFYGTTYTQVCASSNGALYFVSSAATCNTLNDFNNIDLSSGAPAPDLPAIYPFWTDLTFNDPAAGAAYYQTIGTPGNRRFIVEWSTALPQGDSSGVTFEVILAEGTNSITMQYQTVNLGNGDANSNGATATVGIHNTGALAGSSPYQQLQWSYDAGVLSNGYVLSFQTSSLPGAPTLTAPANGATGVAPPVTLSWNVATGATSYDVYFGTTSSPSVVSSGTTSLSYNPAGVSAGGTYYWQIVARNSAGSTPSAVYSFSVPSAPAGPGGPGAPTCSYSLSSPGTSFTSPGGTGTFVVTTQAGCGWSVSGIPAWVTITSGASGSGTGTVSYTVATTAVSRTANLVVAGQTFTISESAPSTAPAPVISWNPAPLVYGAPLGAAQLDATTNVAGTFTYTPAAGTILNAGIQTLQVSFVPASGTGYANATATASVTVSQSPQTISFSAIANHVTSDAPITLAASASSGLPVTFSLVSGPANLSGTKLTLTGAPGTVSVQASQAGNGNYAAATPVTQTFTVALGSAVVGAVLNAASYANAPITGGGYSVLFGSGFTAVTLAAGPPPLPTTLGGVTVTLTDSNGQQAPALLYFVSPTQINFVAPDGLAKGPLTVTVTNSLNQSGTFSANLGSVAPALFSGDASGGGPGAVVVVSVNSDGSQSVSLPTTCSGTPYVCTANPIPVAPPLKAVYLSLYGTGIRGLSSASVVTVTVAGVRQTVLYAGPQPTYPGLDQVNVVLDPSLAGKGVVNVVLTIDGTAANPIQINIQ